MTLIDERWISSARRHHFYKNTLCCFTVGRSASSDKGCFSFLSSHPLLVSLPPTEFSRESLLEAAGGLECPLSTDECSSVASVADPPLQRENTQTGTQIRAFHMLFFTFPFCFVFCHKPSLYLLTI